MFANFIGRERELLGVGEGDAIDHQLFERLLEKKLAEEILRQRPRDPRAQQRQCGNVRPPRLRG
ncbi:MAG: hypothetical protein ACXW2Q_12985, partial [Thermoanaerobaculia bacterium]